MCFQAASRSASLTPSTWSKRAIALRTWLAFSSGSLRSFGNANWRESMALRLIGVEFAHGIAPVEKTGSAIAVPECRAVSGCAKNDQISLVASSAVLGSSRKRAMRAPPGQAWPPPSIVISSTALPSAQGA